MTETIQQQNNGSNAAEDFLLNVVVIDDQAGYGNGYGEVAAVAPKLNVPVQSPMVEEEAESSDTKPDQATADQVASEKPETHDLDAGKMISAFAEKGIICSVYKPLFEKPSGENGDIDPNEEIERIEKLTRNADLVVLDWRLGGGPEKTLAIIDKIVKGDKANGGRLRLVVIYTAESALNDPEQQTRELLESLGEPVTNREIFTEDALPVPRIAAQSIGLNVVFVNKVGASTDRAVAFEGIPDFALEEFSRITEGILRAGALKSISAIRNNALHLLSLFDEGKDIPLMVGHLCANAWSSDIGGFCAELIADEIRHLLERSNIAQEISSAMSEYLTGDPGDNCKDCRARGKKPSQTQIEKCAKDNTLLEISYLATLKHRSEWIVPQNGSWTPRLTLGTIVKDQASGEVYICVQARCDSVRLEGQRPFPMLKLEKTSSKPFHVALKEESTYKRYKINEKGYNIEMLIFTAEDAIIADKKDGEFIFTANKLDGNNVELVWKGDLKDSVAQRVVHSLAQHMSRVGLDEFEWLRLKG